MDDKVAQAKSEVETNELFILACARGLLADATELLARGANPAFKDKKGLSAAHFASAKGELEVVRLLHQKGVDLDVEDLQGRTPLHYAAMHNHENVVKLLVEKRAWMDVQDGSDDSPLHLAVRHGSDACAQRLLKAGANARLRNKRQLTAFGEAIAAGNLRLAKAIAATSNDCFQERAAAGLTLLHVAAGMGHNECVKWLLENGADARSSDNDDGASPLHCAAACGSLACAQTLLSRRADPCATNNDGLMPYQLVPDEEDDGGHSDSKAVLELLRKAAKQQGGAAATSEQRAVRSTSAQQQRSSTASDARAAFVAMDSTARIAKVRGWLGKGEKVWQKDALLSGNDNALRCLATAQRLADVVTCQTAVASLHEDQDFQQDLGDSAIRSAIETIRADPESYERYADNGAVMAVMAKLRRLREVLKHNGGLTVALDDLVAGDAERQQQNAAKLTALRQSLQSALQSVADAIVDNNGGATADSSTQHADGQKAWQQHIKHVVDPAAPAEHVPANNGGSNGDVVQQQSWLQRLARQMLIQFLHTAIIGGVMFLFMWWNEMLPWQSNQFKRAMLDAINGAGESTDAQINVAVHGEEL